MLQLLAQIPSNGGTSTSVAGGSVLIMLVVALLGLAMLAVWVWALIDCIGNTSLDGTMKIVWVLVIIFTGILGAAIYLLVGRGNRSIA